MPSRASELREGLEPTAACGNCGVYMVYHRPTYHVWSVTWEGCVKFVMRMLE